MAQIETKYKKGDVVWWAHCGTMEVTETCPVCFGKYVVHVILGNDEDVTVPCNYCGHGYEGPKGYIKDYKYIAEPKQVAITAIRIEQNDDELKVEYYTQQSVPIESGVGTYNIVLYPEFVFSMEAEALQKCTEVAKEHNDNLFSKPESVKKDNLKSYTWNAGYHMRKAKKCKEEIAYHEKQAQTCKERAKK